LHCFGTCASCPGFGFLIASQARSTDALSAPRNARRGWPILVFNLVPSPRLLFNSLLSGSSHLTLLRLGLLFPACVWPWPHLLRKRRGGREHSTAQQDAERGQARRRFLLELQLYI
jgi:hypothetical protein